MNNCYKVFLLMIIVSACNGPVMYKKKEPVTVSSVTYKIDDLQKIKWIEGNWKAMDDDEPFYEVYKFINDSTITILNYELKGTDTTNAYTDKISWKDGLYFLGEKLDWAAAVIEDSVIEWHPNNSNVHNDISWKLRSDSGWDATLTSPKGIKVYNMQKVR